MSIPFARAFDPAYGRAVRVTPRIRRVTAENPGPFTFTGTGTYIVGQGDVAVIDPGPDDAAHLDALIQALAGETVRAILITHTHRDHSPLARRLAAETGAPILAARPPAPGGEGLEESEDGDFRPDRVLAAGERVRGPDWTLRVLPTPGHASNHLAFALEEENALFCGDHVMGWSTTVVAPPDGDMRAYMTSLRAVMAEGFAVLYPTHGAPIQDPGPFLAAYLAHRLEREDQILARLAAGDRRIHQIVPALYAQVDQGLWPAAARSVLAHLIALVQQGRVVSDGTPSLEASFQPADQAPAFRS